MSYTTDPTGRWVVPNEITIALPTPPARIASGLRALGLDELADAGFPSMGYTERGEYQLTGFGKPVQTGDLAHLLRLIGQAQPKAVVCALRRSVRAWPDGSKLVGMWEFFKPHHP
ncbi:hypothetical protein ACWDG9_16785 [Streptomyces sp. NPDC001073]